MQLHQVGAQARLQPAAVGDAEEGQRLPGGGRHGAWERDAPPGQVAHGRIQGDHGPGQAAIRCQHAAIALDHHGEPAEHAPPRRRPGERHAVAHEEEPVRRLRPQDERPEGVADVMPVGDQLDVGVVREERRDRQPRRVVVDARHAVEEVGGRPGARRVPRPAFLHGGRRVAQRGRHASRPQPADQLQRPRQLRRDRDEAHPVDERLQVRDRHVGRHPDMGRVLGALLGGRDERPLQVEAKGARTIVGGGRHPAPHPLRERGQLAQGRRHGRRQERRDAVAEERPGHPVQRAVRAHRVVAATAMDVDIDEPRGDVRAAGRSVLQLHLGDPAVPDHDPPGVDPLLEDQLAPDDGLGAHDAAPAPEAAASAAQAPSAPLPPG